MTPLPGDLTEDLTEDLTGDLTGDLVATGLTMGDSVIGLSLLTTGLDADFCILLLALCGLGVSLLVFVLDK